MHKDVQEILFTEEKLEERIKELAKQISEDYKDKNPLIIGILKGTFVFMAELIKKLDIECELDFMIASSYGKRVESSGIVAIKKEVEVPVKGKNIIIMEDIIDSGNTLSTIKKLLLKRGAEDVKICTLLDKPSRRKVELEADYFGFKIEDYFIVGYGLDYNEKYRNLPYIGILKPEACN